ncbi:MAG: nucleoside deaminase [Candidatus Poribacteria bacterium]|nr:nucleoside deaminase [Candidatus Poribacteria bacterium]
MNKVGVFISRASVSAVILTIVIGITTYTLSRSSLGVSKADAEFMRQAYIEAELALETGDFPVGSVLVIDGKVVGKGHNEVIRNGDVRDHAEMLAIKRALRDLGEEMFAGVQGNITLYTTYEPCEMCTGLIVWTRVPRVVVGKRKSFRRLGRYYYDHLIYRLTERSGIDEQKHDNLVKQWKRTN